MLASARAELLVLRKWPVAWGLLLVMPALTLLVYYVLPLVQYLGDTPGAKRGPSAQRHQGQRRRRRASGAG